MNQDIWKFFLCISLRLSMTISFPLTEKFYIIHNAPPLIVFVLDKCCVLATEIFWNYPKVGSMWNYHKYLLHTQIFSDLSEHLITNTKCTQFRSIPFRWGNKITILLTAQLENIFSHNFLFAIFLTRLAKIRCHSTTNHCCGKTFWYYYVWTQVLSGLLQLQNVGYN